MVTKYGMSDRLGPIAYGSDNGEVFLGRDMGQIRNYSEKVAAEIDAEVRSIIDAAYNKTEKILTDHMDQLHCVAQYLMEHEKVDGETFRTLMEGEQSKSSEE
jgi:cell division protease FtsH